MCACAGGTVTLHKTEAELSEISWTDFGDLQYNAVYELGSQQSYETGKKYNGTDANGINNKVFKGGVKFENNTQLIYGSTGASTTYIFLAGIWFEVKDNNLTIRGNLINMPEIHLKASDASKYGLKNGFANERFNLEIRMEDRDLAGTEARLTVNINDVTVIDYDKITRTAEKYGDYTIRLGDSLLMQAGSLTMYEAKEVLTEISWKDFGLQSGTVYTAVDGEQYNSAKKLTSKETLNNTEFRGDIIFADNSTLLYASCGAGTTQSWLSGLKIGIDNGMFFVNANYFDMKESIAISPEQATDFDVTSFVGQRLSLRIRMTEMTTDEAIVSMWLNGKAIIEQAHLTKQDDTNVTYKFKLGSNIISLNGAVMVYKESEALTPISWSDFGFDKGTVYDKDNPWEHTKTVTGLESLNNTEFVGEIVFSDNSGIRYFAQDHNVGMEIGVKDGAFCIGANGFLCDEVLVPSTDASKYGIDSFANTKITLKIQIREVTTTDAIVDVYVNNVLVKKPIVIKANGFALGKQLNACYNGSVIIPNEDVEVPSNLMELSWEEFGFSGGFKTTEGQRKVSVVESINNTLFNGDVCMPSGSWMRYAEGETNQIGSVYVRVNADGILTVSVHDAGVAKKTFTAHPTLYGLTTFVNSKFNLKIGMMDLDTDAKIGIWINNQIVSSIITVADTGKLSFGLGINTSEGIIPKSLRTTAPSNLANIYINEWTPDSTTENVVDYIDTDWKLSSGETRGKHPKREDLFGTTFNEVVKYEDTEGIEGQHLIVYGGIKANGWLGLRISLDGDKMSIMCHDGTAAYVYTLDPQIAGLGDSFRGVEFSWKLDTVKLGNNVLLYMSFDEQLYNNAPLVFYNFADKMSSYLYYASYEGDNAEDNIHKCWITLGAALKELPALYHDLEKSPYTYPNSYTISKVEQRVSVADGWTKIEEPDKFLAGDYRITFNDGVSDYMQEVVLYHYGDVNASDLVRAKKLVKGTTTVEQYLKSVARVCDVDYDGATNEADVTSLRLMAVDAYDEGSKMEVSGFFSPSGSMVNDETYKALKEAGITQIVESDVSYTDDPLSRFKVYEEISYAQKYGMTVYVQDGRLYQRGLKGDTTITAEDVLNASSNYREYYQAFAGLFIADELKSKTYYSKTDDKRFIEDFTYLAQAIKAAGIDGWTNSFGGGNFYKTQNEKNNYFQFLKTFKDTMCISSLGFTSYPFWDEYNDGYVNSSHKYSVENTSTDYFTNLAMAKAVAGKDISFRTFVQTGEGFEYTPNNNYTKGQFLWNANTNLAFGSKGTQYFPMVHPESLKNYSNGTCASGLLDATGEKTKYYAWAKEVNQQIAAVDDVLMNATNTGYMSTGGYAKTKATDVVSEIKLYNTNTVLPWTDPIETISNTIVDSTKGYNGATVSSSDNTYGAFVGCFEMNADSKYAGKHAMYIVNFNADEANSNTITVNLGSSKEVTVIYNGETKVMTAAEVTQTLQAGEAVLVVY